MATTTNFGWETPDDTDLVKDGAAAMRTLGSAIDTSLVDLKGGTTGQVLSKASATDLDFSWVAVDPLTILDAKGDLITATAADTPARLAVGTNGQTLVADSSTSTGLKWATPAGGGKVLQVVYGSTNTYTSTASTTYVDTNLSASITPTLSTSKVLVLVSQQGCGKETALGAGAMAMKLVRGATDILLISDIISYTNSANKNSGITVSTAYLDSPATTSSTTYKTQYKTMDASTTVVANNFYAAQASNNSTIILMEIGA